VEQFPLDNINRLYKQFKKSTGTTLVLIRNAIQNPLYGIQVLGELSGFLEDSYLFLQFIEVAMKRFLKLGFSQQ
jgi:hypothetical protein